MKKIILILMFLLMSILAIFLFLNNNHFDSSYANEKLTITTSNYALESMTTSIVGSKADVKEAYDFTTEIHEKTSLTAKELTNILESDIFICISETYEPFVSEVKLAKENGETDVEIVEISLFYGDALNDEHIFLSPKQAQNIVEIIYTEVSEFDTSNRSYYEKNYEEQIEELKTIDEDYKDFSESINKTIYVEHDAYYYLRQDYNLTIKGIHGKSHESEVTSKDLENIIKDIEEQNIKVIYNENSEEEDSVVKAIQGETGVKVEVLNNLEVNNGMNYIEVYKSNLEVLKRV